MITGRVVGPFTAGFSCKEDFRLLIPGLSSMIDYPRLLDPLLFMSGIEHYLASLELVYLFTFDNLGVPTMLIPSSSNISGVSAYKPSYRFS